MAYTKAPMQDTYQTKQIPLIYEWDSRHVNFSSLVDDTVQTVAQNVFYELVESKTTGENYYNVIKRDGVSSRDNFPNTILGIYYWEIEDIIVIVTPAAIIRYDAGLGITVGTTATTSFNSASDLNNGVNFTEFLFENGDVQLVICGSTVFGTFTSAGVWTPCVDADRPTSLFVCPVFLDGYLFLLDTQGNIQNSDLNSPLTWTAGNTMTVESYPDRARAIARSGNYVIALSANSLEWFYDAANPTGTPLASVNGATQNIGYIQGLCATDNNLHFVGRSFNGTPSVYKVVGLKVSELGSPTVRRWLDGTDLNPNTRGAVISMGGHRFYAVSNNQESDVVPRNTYMLDLDNGMWTSLIIAQETKGPLIFSSTTVFQQDSSATHGYVQSYFSLKGDTSLLQFFSRSSDDDGVDFTCKFVTRPLDFGNYRLKFASRLVFNTDQSPTPAIMNVSWSDDDMQTYSTPRTVELSKVYQPLWACGAFRKRSFQITYTAHPKMRWRSVEIDYNQGQA